METIIHLLFEGRIVDSHKMMKAAIITQSIQKLHLCLYTSALMKLSYTTRAQYTCNSCIACIAAVHFV